MPACSEYQRRGFKNLMVSFGCTGGQHRSVYLAEQLAKHLRATSGVEVIVRPHRRGEAQTDEGDDSGCRPGHAPAPAYRRPPQGAGRRSPAARCLEIALARLRAFGVNEVIVNAHHYAEMIVDYLAGQQQFRHEDRGFP